MRVALLASLCACGPSIHAGSAGTVQSEAPLDPAYDLSQPVIDSDDAVADALLLLPLIEDPSQRERWLHALASRVLGRDITSCDEECVTSMVGKLAESRHPGVRLARSQDAERGVARATLRSAMSETGVLRERAAVVVVAAALRAYAVVLSVDALSQGAMLLGSHVPLCEGLDAGMQTPEIARLAQECASELPSSPDWQTLSASTDAILIALLAHALHQALEVIRAGESRVARTLVQSGLLQQQLQHMAAPLILPITPAWVSSTPFIEDGSRERYDYLPQRAGFAAHVQASATHLRLLPTVTPGHPVSSSFPSPQPLTPESWNRAIESEAENVRLLAGLYESEAEPAEEEPTPEWLDESDEAAPETTEAQPAESLDACATDNVGGRARHMNLIVDQDATASRVLEVLRRVASEDTRVSWLAVDPQGEPTSVAFLVGPAEPSEDCARHLDLSSLESLHGQLDTIAYKRINLAAE